MGDEALLRAYLRYEKAAADEVSRINGTKREIAKRMKTRGRLLEEIAEDTGLDVESIKKL
jgi:predicted transposase YdaD